MMNGGQALFAAMVLHKQEKEMKELDIEKARQDERRKVWLEAAEYVDQIAFRSGQQIISAGAIAEMLRAKAEEQ